MKKNSYIILGILIVGFSLFLYLNNKQVKQVNTEIGSEAESYNEHHKHSQEETLSSDVKANIESESREEYSSDEKHEEMRRQIIDRLEVDSEPYVRSQKQDSYEDEVVEWSRSKKSIEYSAKDYERKTTVKRKEDYISTDRRITESKLKAASHNDNQEYPFFLEFLYENRNRDNFSNRYTVEIKDGAGNPVYQYPFEIVDKKDKVVHKSVTYADGMNYCFPNLNSDRNKYRLPFYLKYGKEKIKLNEKYQKITSVQLNNVSYPKPKGIDVVFLIDATGSMGDEIDELKNTIQSISQRVRNTLGNVSIRWNWVAYRDKHDSFNVMKSSFESSIDEFFDSLIPLSAEGGGDTPENMQAGLKEAIHNISWNDNNMKLCFLLGDAPTHYYDNYDSYLELAQQSNEKGIKIFTLGASGLNIIGEIQYRKIAALTNGEFIFLTYGETGESSGSQIAKVSHHTGSNYQPRKLDNLITGLIKKEAAYQFDISNPITVENKKIIIEEYSDIRVKSLYKQIFSQLKELKIENVNIGLSDFLIDETVSNDISDYLIDLSESELLNYKDKYKIIERNRIREIIEEQKIALSGLIKGEIKIGQLEDCNFLIVGKVYKVGSTEIISVKALEVETGEIKAAARVMM